jgi:putative ABC transport system permease protein
VPGVEQVTISGWALLGGGAWNSFISVNGAPPGPVLGYFLSVSPGWIETMKIALIDGRDFRDDDTSPGAAIVSETFARQFFNGGNPIGKTFAKGKYRYQVVGLVHDAPYRNMREPILPVAYVPFHAVDAMGVLQPVRNATFMVRSSAADPLPLIPALRMEVPRARAGFRVSNARAQAELVRAQTVRERLLAMLALFFAVVAILLAGVGLYGVLDYSVLQRRREIGIRMAIGAQASDIALGVTAGVVRVVFTGAIGGLALGVVSGRYASALLYQVTATDPGMLALPFMAILGVSLLASIPAVVRAVRLDPVTTLRAE